MEIRTIKGNPYVAVRYRAADQWGSRYEVLVCPLRLCLPQNGVQDGEAVGYWVNARWWKGLPLWKPFSSGEGS